MKVENLYKVNILSYIYIEEEEEEEEENYVDFHINKMKMLCTSKRF